MKLGISPKGYFTIKLLKGEKDYYSFFVHRLVLETFVGPCPEGMETRHLDGDPTNNHVSNLAWGTAKENFKDRLRHGTHVPLTPPKGEKNHKARLTEEHVREIVRSELLGYELAEKFGVTPTAISLVRRGMTWRHVTGFASNS